LPVFGGMFIPPEKTWSLKPGDKRLDFLHYLDIRLVNGAVDDKGHAGVELQF